MKEIILTQGKVTVVDDKDYDTLSKYSWSALQTHSGRWYAVRSLPRPSRKMVYMHREILRTEGRVDHINHDGLDNQRQNIRVCTQTQNLGNTRKRIETTSRYKGVSWHKAGKKWMAQIRCDGLRQYLGSFHSEVEAAHAYNKAAQELFGEFALLNIIDVEDYELVTA